jgi:hypothetical protein
MNEYPSPISAGAAHDAGQRDQLALNGRAVAAAEHALNRESIHAARWERRGVLGRLLRHRTS